MYDCRPLNSVTLASFNLFCNSSNNEVSHERTLGVGHLVCAYYTRVASAINSLHCRKPFSWAKMSNIRKLMTAYGKFF